MDNDTFDNSFDSYYNARRDYRLYRQVSDNYYDPNEDLPPDIHASVYPPEPEIEDDSEPDEPELPDDWQPSEDPLHF
jgi:hypothetical protein